MRVYLSGPMTSLPDLNRPAFDAAEKRLREQGHFVINPHRISALFGKAEEIANSFRILYSTEGKVAVWEYFKEQAQLARSIMDADLAAVRSCDAIYLLRGWESSRGAKKELNEALRLNIMILQEE